MASPSSETLSLRIVAIFIIFLVSALGCLTPAFLITHGCSEDSNEARKGMHYLKSFSAGIVLAVGLCHSLAEASKNLRQVVDYPLAEAVAMVGALLVLILTQIVEGMVAMLRRRSGDLQTSLPIDGLESGATTPIRGGRPAAYDAAGESSAAGGAGTRPGSLTLTLPAPRHVHSKYKLQQDHAGGLVERSESETTLLAQHFNRPISASPSVPADRPHHSENHHQYGHNDAAHLVYTFKKEPLVIAYMMEIGIVFHSVLIGIGLGVITDGVGGVRTLLIAMCIHQFFEGAGLSTCIIEAELERQKTAMMFALFSVTTPLGIALGIGMSSMYDPDTPAAALLQGMFNALAAGILIYLALVDMLMEEFGKEDVRKESRLQAEMIGCVLAGAGVMAVLAVWT